MFNAFKVPSGAVVSVAGYCKAIKVVKSCPSASYSGWGHFPVGGGEVLKAFRKGVQDRINQRGGVLGAGRKWSDSWELEQSRAARKINSPRLIIRRGELPKDLEARFADRIYDAWDF